jgi:hypothetical protein
MIGVDQDVDSSEGLQHFSDEALCGGPIPYRR